MLLISEQSEERAGDSLCCIRNVLMWNGTVCTGSSLKVVTMLKKKKGFTLQMTKYVSFGNLWGHSRSVYYRRDFTRDYFIFYFRR